MCFVPACNFSDFQTARRLGCYTACICSASPQPPHKHKYRLSRFTSSPGERHPLSLFETDSKWLPLEHKLIIIVLPNLRSAEHCICVLLTSKTHSAIPLAISLRCCQLTLCKQRMPVNKMYEVIFQKPHRRSCHHNGGHAGFRCLHTFLFINYIIYIIYLSICTHFLLIASWNINSTATAN